MLPLDEKGEVDPGARVLDVNIGEDAPSSAGTRRRCVDFARRVRSAYAAAMTPGDRVGRLAVVVPWSAERAGPATVVSDEGVSHVRVRFDDGLELVVRAAERAAYSRNASTSAW